MTSVALAVPVASAVPVALAVPVAPMALEARVGLAVRRTPVTVPGLRLR
ncbi:hypothetical protein ACFYYR_19380 [Streptomyces sp. NPDC001922]